MNKVINILASIFLLAACMEIKDLNPYEKDLHNVSISLFYSEEQLTALPDGVVVKIVNVLDGSMFEAMTDADGRIGIQLPNGLYSVSTSYSANDELYSAAVDRILVSGQDKEMKITLDKIKTGDLLIKEIYCGGCKKLPAEGEYQADKYIIVHNNTDRIQYVDSLCFGIVSPANSTATNPWLSNDSSSGGSRFPDFIPLFEAVWQIGGNGTDFPLEPGEDAVIAVCGAIDHSAQYPLSVNLNHEDYFVCYNTTYFPNTSYHPAPGNKIRQERILEVAIKTGKSNAFPMSVSSPGVVIFKPRMVTMQEFVAESGSLLPIPGSGDGSRAVCVPLNWVLDAVDVFDGRSSNNLKRFASQIDGGAVYQSNTFLGHTLMRRTNQAKSQSLGFEVLVDTNNSSNDFFESERQSLHKD